MPKNARPILADWFLKFIEESERRYDLAENNTTAIKETLANANRYVFPARTTDMAERAVKAPKELARFLTLPAKWTWLEFTNPEEGVLLNARENLRYAHAIYCFRRDKPGYGSVVSVVSAQVDLDRGGFQLQQDPDAIPERFLKRFMGAVTLLGAPDLLERRRVEHSRKWNERRARRGELTAMAHDVIELHLTRYEKEQEHEWGEQQRERGVGFTGRHMRHHFVRSHIRITNRGKVTKVSPHYRGDPSLGTAPLTHIVRP
jgi:hypothetical protein